MSAEAGTTTPSSPAGLGYDETLEVIGQWAEQLARACDEADWATPVPTCPGWDLGKLMRHTGRVHRHVAGLVQLRIDGPPERDTVAIDQPDSDADHAEWISWFRFGAAELVAILRATEPSTPMWSWGADQSAAFWVRRMAHETLIHAVDGLLAVGREVAIEPRVAVDGIDELLEALQHSPSFVSQGTPFDGSGTVHLHTTDDDLADGLGEWMIEFDPTGYRFTHGHGKGDVAVRATAQTLELITLGRAAIDGDHVEVFGDRDVLDRFLTGATFR